ncbi:hypothetical protein ACWEOE_27490 [Amycolatopsis sp. NPDC004368]
MSEPLRIPVERLRAVIDVLLNHLAGAEGPTLALEADYFWSIPPDSLHNVYAEPDELTIGSLCDSWQYLENLLRHKEDGVIPHHFVWLSEVLRAVGHPETRIPPD